MCIPINKNFPHCEAAAEDSILSGNLIFKIIPLDFKSRATSCPECEPHITTAKL